MIRPLNVFTAACLCMLSLQTLAQVAEPLIIPESLKNQRAACLDDMDAGERINITDLGKGNLVDDSQPIILCFGDQIFINHDGTLVALNGDPDPSTDAGIGYLFYSCLPTVPGETSALLRSDPCLLLDPMPANGDAWIARGNAEGDVTFHNDGQIQDRFYNGSIFPVWFAPATVTDFGDPPTFDNGSCLNVRTDQAFSVVYLYDITLDAFSTPDLNSLAGMFSLSGGLPEYDGSNYNVTLIKEGNPSVQGTIDNAISHGNTTTFEVPEAGTYILKVSDDKGCSKEFIVNIPNADPIMLCFANGAVATGENICLPITATNFTDIILMGFAVKWDSRLFEYVGVSNIHPEIPISSFDEDFINNGLLKLIAFFDLDIGSTINDNETLFEVCLTAVGPPGSASYFTVSTLSEGGLDVSFINNVIDEELPFIAKPGEVIITIPALADLTHSACPNGSGGVDLTLTAFGGTPPYTVDIVDELGNVYATQTLTGEFISSTVLNMPPGVYNIILDNRPIRRIVLSGDDIMIAHREIHPSCAGQDDGRIAIDSITGGAGDFHVTWIGPGFTRFNDDSLRLLTEGSYQIIATDGNGCSDTTSVDLVANGISLEIRTVPPVCSGQPGSITVTVPGAGGENYNWEWSNSEGTLGRILVAPSPLSLTNLMPDTYTITLRSGQCIIPQTVNLLPNKILSIAIDPSTQLTTTCSGDRDGRIDIYASADRNQSAFQFFWDRVTQDSGVVIIDGANDHSYVTGLPAGTYNLRVVDAQNCEIDTTFTITEPNPVMINAGNYITQPSCPDGQNGRIDLGFAQMGGVQFSPPRAPYIFRYRDENDSLLYRTSAATRLPAGTYRIYVEDANGCSDSTTVELISGPNIMVTLDQENICRGDSVARLTVSGDLTGNTILWSTGETTPTISNLKEGIYAISVTEIGSDGTPCTVVDSIPIIDPVVLVNTILPMQFAPRSLCNEPDSGIIFNLQIDYPGPKSYIWPSLNDTITMGPFISVKSSGMYPFTVIDRTTGCIIFDSVVTAQFPEMISLIIDSTHISCNGQADGAIAITATGRSGQFNFDWESGASTSSASNLSAGIWQLTVTESTDSTCMVPLSITLREPEILTLSLDSAFTQDIRCFGDGDGQIGLIWQGGNQDAAPTIVWSAGGASNTLSATGLDAGIYDIVLTDSKGCTGLITHMIAEPAELFATVPVPDNPVCNGFQTTLTVTGAIGGTGSNYLFSVDNGPAQMLNSLIPVFAGDHLVTVFDERGCQYDTLLSIIDPEPVIVDLGPDLTVALGDSIRLNALVDGPSTIDSYIWTPDQLLSCNNCDAPFANPVEDQLFELIVVDINGCEGQDQIRLSVDKARLVYIPNGFTPNGDGVNDKWQIFTGPGVRQILGTHVFDRWGNLVFESGQEPSPMSFGSAGWDGRADNGLMNPGVYVYLVQVEFIDGRIFTYRGDVTMAH